MKRLFVILVWVLVASGAWAQDDAAFTNFWKLRTLHNPAAAGLGSMLDVNGAYRMEMAGFENGGQVFVLQADMPLFFLSPRHGVGLGFMNDKIGLLSNKRMWVDYAYHHPFGRRHRVSGGIRIALLSNAFKGSGAVTEGAGDNVIPSTDLNGMGFDLDMGLRYDCGEVWHVGVACTHLLSPLVSLGDEKRYQVAFAPTLAAMGGYCLTLRNREFRMMADAMVRSNFQSWRADVALRVAYDGSKVRMYAGLNYSPTVSVALLLGFNFHGAKIGYSYEMYTGGIAVQNGTHELTVGYELDLSVIKRGRNFHQSVRWL